MNMSSQHEANHTRRAAPLAHTTRLLMVASMLVGPSLLGGPLLGTRLQADEPAGKQVEPRAVYVAQDEVQLRSGPSEEYYPTRLLDAGETLQVHYETEDGWLGVRPPAGSFSWLPATDAYLLPGGKAIEITSKSAVSWIGSELGSAKQYRWQVELLVGEQLAVVGEASMKDKTGRETLWYKIAPPAGEFRWIAEREVSREPVRPAKINDPNAKPLAATAAGEARPTNAAAENPAAKNSNVSQAAYQSGTRDDVFGGPPASGPVMSGPSTPRGGSSIMEGGVVDRVIQGDESGGQMSSDVFYDGEYYADEYYQDDFSADGYGNGQYIQNAPTGDQWAGWHAWDFSDDGLRFTLMERVRQRNGTGPKHDPLLHDPYSLDMASKNPGPPRRVMPPQYSTSQGTPALRAPVNNRPWRDPRTLGQNSLGSRTSDQRSRTGATFGNTATNSRDAKELIAQIRENAATLGDSLRDRTDNIGSGLHSRLEQLDRGGHEYGIESPPRLPAASGAQSLPATRGPSDVQWYGIDRSARDSGARTGTGFNSGTSRGSVRADLTSAQLPQAGYGYNPANRTASVDQLRLALSEMVAQPPSMWNLAPIVAETQRLIDVGVDPIERGQARLLLERIEEFSTHATRSAYAPSGVSSASYAAVPGHSAGSNPVTGAIWTEPSSNNAAGNAAPISAPGATQYDATGWLVPVHSSTPGQPTHALTDDSGRILSYVSAMPGMRLDGYVNRPVGVFGLRGFLPTLQAGHIEAGRIVDLR